MIKNINNKHLQKHDVFKSCGVGSLAALFIKRSAPGKAGTCFVAFIAFIAFIGLLATIGVLATFVFIQACRCTGVNRFIVRAMLLKSNHCRRLEL